MKIYSYILSTVGFIFQYIIPIVLFGNVIPYTHESLEAGLTVMGYIAIAIIVIIVSGKLKDKLHGMRKGLVRALLLSLFPVAYWLIAKIGINYILNLFIALAQYWGYMIIFIVIGRLFYIISELVYDKSEKGKVE
jgi:MFS family permease